MDRDNALAVLAAGDRDRHDIFIGLAAPIGSSKAEVIEALEDALETYGYEVQKVRLSDLLDALRLPSEAPLPSRSEPEYHKKRMTAGDQLRAEAGDSALAAVAVVYVASLREQHRLREQRCPVAYVFDSLKHPREAALLRHVYGPGFWLLAIAQDTSELSRNLATQLGRHTGKSGPHALAQAAELIARDEADHESPHGQHVREVFAEADFFLPVSRGMPWRNDVGRFVQGIFDAPFLTPTRDEEAMRHARAAALRSAAIGRQVGAAIVPALGAPLLVGTNEVPKPGGGQYREGDIPDHRDFRTGKDPNPAYIDGIVADLIHRMCEAAQLPANLKSALGDALLHWLEQPDHTGRSILDRARVSDLIEFVRCMHAEEAAIADAARSGTPTNGARLYTTTFPCHLCTKLIIGAGIVEVQYIEPYPKSLAGDLYADLIEPMPSLGARSHDRHHAGGQRIPFRHFTGFGPRRYDEVFCAPKRRAPSGGLIEHHPKHALPVGHHWSEVAVQVKQAEVNLALSELLPDRWRSDPATGGAIGA